MKFSIVILILTVAFGLCSADELPILASCYSYWDQPLDLAVNGSFAYITANNQFLYTFDISNLANPVLQNKIPIHLRSGSLKVDGNRLFIVSGSNVAILSIEDPSSPQLVWRQGVGGHSSISSFACNDRLAVIQSEYDYQDRFRTEHHEYFNVVDISDIANPQILFDRQDGLFLPGSVFINDLLFGYCGVLSIENPVRPFLLAEWEIEVSPLGSNLAGDVLYCIEQSEVGKTLITADVTDPTEPQILSRLPEYASVREMTIHDTFVDLIYQEERYANYAPRFASIDFTDPVRWRATFNDELDLPAITIGSSYDVVAVVDSASQIDFYHRSQDEFELVSRLNNTGSVLAVSANDDFLYASLANGGIGILDFSDRSHPVEINRIELPSDVIDFEQIDNEILYTATADSGIYILSVSNPRQIEILGHYSVAGETSRLQLCHSILIYVESREGQFAGGVRLLDVEDPSNPVLRSTLEGVEGYNVLGNTLYGAESRNILVADITDPSHPRVLRRIQPPNNNGDYYSIRSVYPYSRNLYYLYYDGFFVQPGMSGAWLNLGKLQIVESDTAIFLGEITLSESEYPSVDGEILAWQRNQFVFSDYSGTTPIIEENGHFQRQNNFYQGENALYAQLLDSLCLLACNGSLNFYDVSEVLGIPDYQAPHPDRINLSSFPNPFNGRTTITFNLPFATTEKLSLYNISGQLVGIISEGRLEAGEHSVEFDGSSLSSGIYILKLKTSDIESFSRMVLLK